MAAEQVPPAAAAAAAARSRSRSPPRKRRASRSRSRSPRAVLAHLGTLVDAAKAQLDIKRAECDDATRFVLRPLKERHEQAMQDYYACGRLRTIHEMIKKSKPKMLFVFGARHEDDKPEAAPYGCPFYKDAHGKLSTHSTNEYDCEAVALFNKHFEISPYACMPYKTLTVELSLANGFSVCTTYDAKFWVVDPYKGWRIDQHTALPRYVNDTEQNLNAESFEKEITSDKASERWTSVEADDAVTRIWEATEELSGVVWAIPRLVK